MDVLLLPMEQAVTFMGQIRSAGKQEMRLPRRCYRVNGFYNAPTVVCVFCQNNFLFKTADAFCMMENMILQATELGIASCIISRGYETFDSEEGRRLMDEWGVPEGYACQGFVILGYIDGEQPKSKPRKPGRIKIVE